ncbi:MAG: restriction endonuclease [bacterium]
MNTARSGWLPLPLHKLPNGLMNVLALNTYDFEAFAAHYLEVIGFTSISLLGRSGHQGVDLAAVDSKGQSTVVQCKRHLHHMVSSEPVQRLHSFALARGATRKLLVTTSDFTRQCEEEAAVTGTELINGKKLESQIAQHMPNYFAKASQPQANTTSRNH